MNCPNCNVPLVIAERQSVEIDYCPQCRGVWLDRGELDKILERSAPTKSNDPARSYEERRSPQSAERYEDRPYRKKKREGFLSELFDF